MATPTIRALREHFGPAATITGIQRPYVKEVLAGTNWLSNCIEFNPKGKWRSRRGTLSLALELRRRKFDTAIILPNSPRPAFASWLAGIPQRLGYVRYCRGPLLTERVDPLRDGRKFQPISALNYYLTLAESLGANVDNRRIELSSTPEFDKAAERFWSQHDLHNRRVIAFNTGGAYGAAKSWPSEHFADLAKRLVSEPNTRVVVMCGPAEAETADRICGLAGSPYVHSMSGQKLSIGLTKAAIKRSELLITTDSGPRFFGTAFGIPTITIFGSTDPQWSATGHPLEFNVNISVDCGPCARRVCPLKHHRCMRDLTSEFIYAKAVSVLTEHQRRAA
ncbi:MAG: glycosyltransferase family 9 protein [Planctomycetales bacterium]|nr:glycosyltransferase family 9 protein [Planctomycetales bacterium]